MKKKLLKHLSMVRKVKIDNLRITPRFLTKVLISIPFFCQTGIGPTKLKYFLDVVNSLNDYLEELFYDLQPDMIYGCPDRNGLFFYSNDLVYVVCDTLYVFDFFYHEAYINYKIERPIFTSLNIPQQTFYNTFDLVGDKMIGLDKPRIRDIMYCDKVKDFCLLLGEVLYNKNIGRLENVDLQ